MALGIVFVLNAVALFYFPRNWAFFNLSQNQFGIWSAIAIHDTSSVVGAASKYGNEALQIATTVKLAKELYGLFRYFFLFLFLPKVKGKLKFLISLVSLF